MIPPLVLGTAGHVDHGKTALVRALTGRETDRLAEERARGISIELGFAPLDLPSGRRVGLVDVPGHERFVRHMVAGATGVDGWLLCVAADDGVMPQTREHLDVLRLLGIDRGVVAITRADLMDPAAAVAEVEELVGTGPEIVPVCAPRGDGIPELREALERLVAGLAPRERGGRPRLFIDRAFSVAGAGTVVTGTLWGGAVARGDRVRVAPGGPAGRVRGVHVHDTAVERAAGGRVALALVGVPREEVRRGLCLVREDDAWPAPATLGARLTWLPSAPTTLASGRRLQAFLGTSEVPASVMLLDAETLEPGGAALAELRLERPVVATPGDRIVLRSAERRTVGGAVVIDLAAPRRLSRRARAERLRVLADGTAEEVADMRLREAGAAGLPDGRGGRAFHPDVLAHARASMIARIDGAGVTLAEARAATGLPPAAAAALVDAAVSEGAAERRGDRLMPPGAVAADPVADAVAGLLQEAGRRPPTVHQLVEMTGLSQAELKATLGALRSAGRAAPAEDLWFDPAALEAAAALARAALSARPMGLGDLRDLWGVGRKHAQAIGAWMDASGVTARQGAVRVLRGSPRTSASS